MAFPDDIIAEKTLVDNEDDVMAVDPNTVRADLRALETKIGITDSTVNTTIDYFLKHASGAYRNHTHDGTSDDGANIPVANITGTLPVTSGGTGQTTLAGFLGLIYPVGCIYTTTVSTNPATVFGFGTWSAFGSGKVLVGLDSGDTDFDTVEETGGEKTHILTIPEMPAHTHTYDKGTLVGESDGLGSAQKTWTSTNTGSAGGGTAHNNLQPYIVVYFWKRSA